MGSNHLVTFIIAVVTGLMGVAVVYLGWWMMAASVTFQAASRPFTATVVSVERHQSNTGTDTGSTTSLDRKQGRTTYRPTVAFTDDIGVWEEPIENLSENYDFEIGSPVSIRYVPGDPPRVRIDTKEYPFVAFGFFALLGGGFMVGGIAVAYRSFRVMRRRYTV